MKINLSDRDQEIITNALLKEISSVEDAEKILNGIVPTNEIKKYKDEVKALVDKLCK